MDFSKDEWELWLISRVTEQVKEELFQKMKTDLTRLLIETDYGKSERLKGRIEGINEFLDLKFHGKEVN